MQVTEERLGSGAHLYLRRSAHRSWNQAGGGTDGDLEGGEG